MLEINDLRKSYGQTEVLHGLNLEVATATFTAILGPSGSGKTTLLRVIAGFERANGGSVRLNGNVVDDSDEFITPEHRRIGYVPQEGGLFPHLSVAENVGFGLARPLRKGARVSELLEMVGLGGFASRYPHQLSGGQQQRVALARALAIQPSLVLLDEPFSSLDANLRQSLRGDVQRVLREISATALLVTHDQDEALSFADHVAVLREGRIAQHDTPQAIYAHPATPELARTLGEVNLIEGVIKNGVALTALGTLQLEPRSSVNEGSALVLIRPEQIAFATGPDTPPCGTIVDSVFYGHDLVVKVALNDTGTTVLVRRPGTEQEPSVGTSICLVVIGNVASWKAESHELSS